MVLTYLHFRILEFPLNKMTNQWIQGYHFSEPDRSTWKFGPSHDRDLSAFSRKINDRPPDVACGSKDNWMSTHLHYLKYTATGITWYIYIYIHSISLRICTMYQYTCILYIYNVWVTLIVISLFCCQCLWGLGTPLAPPWHPLGTPLAPPWHPLGTQPFSRCGPGQLFRHVLGFLLGDSLRLHLGRRDQAEISLGSHEHPS